MANASQTCVLTGATGYVGGRLRMHLEAAGGRVVDWSRQPGPGGVQFQLGQEVDPQAFAGATALVHCAYDFSPQRWDDLATINVRGSEKLFRAARAAGVARIVFISSASAFDGCCSRYGRAKLAIESLAQSAAATIIRPGLVYGDSPGGVFGKLVAQVKKSHLIPLFAGGHQVQYLVHDADLGALVLRALAGEIPAAAGPILLAHGQPWTMRQLLERIARAVGRRPIFVPVPWPAVWLGFKTMETLGLPAPFRSDSLVGLVYQNPHPSFATAQALGAECRPLTLTREMLA